MKIDHIYKQPLIKISNSGFTFVELILYVALIFLVFGSLSAAGLITIREQQKSGVVQEVGATGRYLSERLKNEIRQAKNINSVSSTMVSLQSFTTANDPTIIDYVGGNVRIKQGASSVVTLNPSNTVISNLTFTNLTSSDDRSRNIRFEFTIQSATNSSQIYTNQMTLQGDAEVRSN